MDFTAAPTPTYIGQAAPGIFWPLVSPSKVAEVYANFEPMTQTQVLVWNTTPHSFYCGA
jgi:hypothetical protein